MVHGVSPTNIRGGFDLKNYRRIEEINLIYLNYPKKRRIEIAITAF